MNGFLRLLTAACLGAGAAAAQDVGSGSPNIGIEQRFINAFYRGGFNRLVTLPPLGNVQRFGTDGYRQEFAASGAGAALEGGPRFALIKAGSSLALPPGQTYDVFQMYPGIYTPYLAVGVNTAGYPTMDSQFCTSPTGGTCLYQIFDKKYAFFDFTVPPIAGDTATTFSVRDPFFTRWQTLGGITALGPATSSETAVTAKSGVRATIQTFLLGGLYNITSGNLTGKLFLVGPGLFPYYTLLGQHTGPLGLPISEELSVAGGKFRQNFEGGSLEYGPGIEPVLRPAVGSVTLNANTSTTLRMNLGETLTLRATVLSTLGEPLTDREVSWFTSNSRVVAVAPSGATATIRATGGGSAVVAATTGGKTSPSLNIFVSAPCCQIGEGAPTSAIQQAFQDAAARNRLQVKLPAASPVRRVGLGYVQDLQSTDASARYLLARSDRSPGVFLVTGDLLRAYEAAGGPGGALGYPVSDSTATGRQLFEGGALAGNPVFVVTGAPLARWAQANYETGPLGPPTGAATAVLSSAGSLGRAQNFRSATLYAAETGAVAGRTHAVGGLILSRYAATGGPGGSLGLPASEEYAVAEGMRQEFEGGSIRYAPGDAEAEAVESERKPQVVATPAAVTAGGRVRIAIGGFPPNSSLRVSFTGTQAPAAFNVTTESGAYTWQMPVSAAAPSAAIAIRVQQTGGVAVADGSYTVRSTADARLQLLKVRGDTQTGMPGAVLPAPLVVSLKDEDGSPLAGVAVQFNPSPGAQVISASAVTDERGEASATLRLPATDGVALMTATAARLTTTFSARVAPGALPNFPKQTATGDLAEKGALAAAASSVLRYYQNRGELPSSLGLAEPPLLSQFLKDFCVVDAGGNRLCDGLLTPFGAGEPILNPWRLSAFVGGNLDAAVERAEAQTIRDILAQGAPAILALSLNVDDRPLGAHYVVAIGIDSGGGIEIHDPNPVLNRTSLAAYTSGFPVGSRRYQATLAGLIRLTPRLPSPTGFLVAAQNASLSLTSPSGACGGGFDLAPAAVVTTAGPGNAPQTGKAAIHYCEGGQPVYQLDLSAEGAFQASLTDLGNPGRRTAWNGQGQASYKVSRPATLWETGALAAEIGVGGVLNAASLAPALAPGALASVFGAALSRPGGSLRVEIDGQEAAVVMASPFQLNVQIPLDAQPGSHVLRVLSPYGVAEQAIQIDPVAPAIFRDASRRPTIVHADGKPNSPVNPASRGTAISIYCTGLGAVVPRGALSAAAEPVTVFLQGRPLQPSFAGLAPSLPGVYLVNVALPADLPPSLESSLFLRQGGVDSAPVEISVQ